MATKTKRQVIYSEIESTIHVNEGDVETLADGTVHQAHSSRILLPGDTIGLDEVPSYMLDLVKEKKAPGLLLLDEEEAEKLNEFARLIRGEGKVSDLIEIEAPEIPGPLASSEPKL